MCEGRHWQLEELETGAQSQQKEGRLLPWEQNGFSVCQNTLILPVSCPLLPGGHTAPALEFRHKCGAGGTQNSFHLKWGDPQSKHRRTQQGSCAQELSLQPVWMGWSRAFKHEMSFPERNKKMKGIFVKKKNPKAVTYKITSEWRMSLELFSQFDLVFI